MYSEEDFNKLEQGKVPEIKRSNSDMVLLKIFGLGSDISEFDLIDKLDPQAVN